MGDGDLGFILNGNHHSLALGPQTWPQMLEC